MINIVQEQQIIPDYYRKRLSIGEISRQTGLHRKTIRVHIEKYKQETGFDQPGSVDTSDTILFLQPENL